MLRVNVEIIPFGNEEEKRTLATYEIVNVSPVGKEVAKYEIKKVGVLVCKVRNHKRSDGFEKLIVRVFKMFCKGG